MREIMGGRGEERDVRKLSNACGNNSKKVIRDV